MVVTRPARAEDCEAIAAIYNHYILHTVVSFEESPLQAEDILSRQHSVNEAGLPWLVSEEPGAITGYAYATPWRSRAAYRHSVEISVYLDHSRCGVGTGTALYTELFSLLRKLPVHSIIGGIALPTPASVALHEKFGMQQVSHHREVGYKHGQWIDVGYWQVLLPMESP
jgi:phosphinothricin acetyltransferase